MNSLSCRCTHSSWETEPENQGNRLLMIKWTINADKEFATGDWVNQKPFEQLSFQLKHCKEVGKFKELKQDGRTFFR